MARTLLTAVLLAALAGLSACRSAAPTPKPKGLSPEGKARAEGSAHYLEALLSRYHNDVPGAITNLAIAYRNDPGDEALALQLTLLLLEDERDEEAVRLVEDHVARNPEAYQARMCLAVAYRSSGQTNRADHAFSELLDYIPNDLSAYRDLAQLHLSGGRFELAEAVLDQALERFDDPDDLPETRGRLFIRQAVHHPDPEERRRYLLKAIDVFETLEAADPTKAIERLHILGDLYILNEQPEKAVACFEQIERMTPDDPAIREKLALRFLQVGDAQRALDTIRGLIAADPDNPRLRVYLGDLYRHLKQPEEARTAFRAAIRLDPEKPIFYIKCALSEVDASAEQAVTTLREGLNRLPNNARLLEMLGYTLLRIPDPDQAQAVLAQAAALMEAEGLEPLSDRFAYASAIAALATGKTHEAAEWMEQIYLTAPRLLMAFVDQARQTQDLDAEALETALDLLARRFEDNPEALTHLGALYSYQGAPARAVDVLERARASARRAGSEASVIDADFHFLYGAALERVGRFEEAETELRAHLALQPEHADAYNYLAYMWAERGTNLTEAMTFIEIALSYAPDSAAYLDTRGWIFYALGRYPEALADLEHARVIDPTDPTITEHVGDVHLRMGRPDLALAFWEEAFIFNPDNPDLERKLREAGSDIEALRQEAKGIRRPMEEAEPVSNESAPVE